MDFERIKDILKQEAESKGVSEYEIYAVQASECSVETLDKKISTFSSSTSGGLCFRALVDSRMGYASTELYEDEEIRSLVGRAIENAKITEKLDTVGIFSGSEHYETVLPDTREKNDAIALKTAALKLSDALFESSRYIRSGTLSAMSEYSLKRRIANSRGLDLSSEAGACIAVAESVVEKDGESQAAYEIREYKDAASLPLIASMATERALGRLGAQSVPTGKYDIVIDGKQMKALLSVFSSVFSAKSVLRGISLLAGKIGERVASDVITLTDDPMREGYAFRTPFDAEGVATAKKNVIEHGVLKTFLHNRETALTMNADPTANASKASYASPVGISPYVFSIERGSLSEEDLLRKLDTGIYVTEFKGLHAGANAVTGDFSLESAGFLVEGGKKTKAVKSFTVSGNFFELLKKVEALSDTVKGLEAPTSFTAFGSPDALVCDMSIAGK